MFGTSGFTKKGACPWRLRRIRHPDTPGHIPSWLRRFLRDAYGGRIHDKPMADAPPAPLPTGRRLWQDLGVLACTLPQGEIVMPTTKPRGRELPLAQPRATPARHERRWRMAPGHRRVKRCGVVTDRRQLWEAGIRALMMARCCALPTVRVRLTPWQPRVEAGETQLLYGS
jgi:hypothetical protein